MLQLFSVLSVLVIVFGMINLVRMALFLVGSDIYNLRSFKHRRKKLTRYPSIDVVIPAYNEERSIVGTVSSVFASDYPKELIKVIVVSDGSTDSTDKLMKTYISKHRSDNIHLVTQSNLGKAHALNNGIQNYSKAELVMCLDADARLEKHALSRAALYFENPEVAAVASNVKIERRSGLLNLIQIFEYLISYQMKKAQTVFNIEYIIGGVGSTFRRSTLIAVGYYDTNTVTEDIDLTMKMLRLGNKKVRVIYGADVISYTQSAVTVQDLIKQRRRWKWGRYQTFLKNKQMFFSGKPIFTKGFSWIYLPYALFSDFAFIFEPLVILYMFIVVFIFRDIWTLYTAMLVISGYMSLNILAEETISFKDRLLMIPLVPCMYFFFYVLSFVEYMALLKSLIVIHTLGKSIEENKSTWVPIERKGFINATVEY